MQLEERIKIFSFLGQNLESFRTDLKQNQGDFFLKDIKNNMCLAEQINPWFTIDNQMYSFDYWSKTLTEENLKKWLKKLPKNTQPKKIGIICAGNIPMVGFHDILSVILSGNFASIKLSSKDNVLIPYFLDELSKIFKGLKNFYEFSPKIQEVDAVIATGSNNTARYFESYFKNIPHIIRRNRTSVAVFSGKETDADLVNFADDVFRYFGLGCRNVTQIFIPEGFDLNRIFKAFFPWKEIINHHKYANNYDYNKAVYLMNQYEIIENGFLLLKESDELKSPLAVLFYKRYKDMDEVRNFIAQHNEQLQCVVGNATNQIPFGQAQKPRLDDYADGIDTLTWLSSL